jgi:N-acyl-D-aspartate/D-glutamate deacylase
MRRCPWSGSAGKVADITIFDPDTIASKPREPVATLPAGGVQVKRDAVGIDHVIVNGTVLLENGELTGDHPRPALPGRAGVERRPLSPLPSPRQAGRGSAAKAST